jgi:hypothetical protein
VVFGCTTLAGELNRTFGVESASDLMDAEVCMVISLRDFAGALSRNTTHLTVSAGDKVMEGDLDARFDWLFLLDDRAIGLALYSSCSHPWLVKGVVGFNPDLINLSCNAAPSSSSVKLARLVPWTVSDEGNPKSSPKLKLDPGSAIEIRGFRRDLLGTARPPAATPPSLTSFSSSSPSSSSRASS